MIYFQNVYSTFSFVGIISKCTSTQFMYALVDYNNKLPKFQLENVPGVHSSGSFL